MLLLAFNTSTWAAEAGEYLSPGQPGLYTEWSHREMLSWKTYICIYIPEESVESSEASLWVSVISKPTHRVPFLSSVLTFTLLCINSTVVTRPAQMKMVASNETGSHWMLSYHAVYTYYIDIDMLICIYKQFYFRMSTEWHSKNWFFNLSLD